MNALSYWEQESFLDLADVVIIGCGITGLQAGIALKELAPSLKVTIVERGPLPSGASTRNAGFACFGSISEILDDLESADPTTVFDLVERRWRGLQKLRSLVGDQRLRYQPLGGYEIFKKKDRALFEKCLANVASFNEILADITGEKNTYAPLDANKSGFGFRDVTHMIFNRMEGQLHPGEMMRALLGIATEKDIPIFNGLDITEIHEASDKVDLIAANGWRFAGRKVLVTVNGFARRFFPNLDLRPARNQVLITDPIDNLPFRGAFHYDKGYVYFRNVDVPGRPDQSRVLLGGFRNLAPEPETTEAFGTTENIQNAMLTFLQETILPSREVAINTWWSGIMGLGSSKRPLVEMTSQRIGMAVRLGGMGVALGSLVGKEAADMIFQK